MCSVRQYTTGITDMSILCLNHCYYGRAFKLCTSGIFDANMPAIYSQTVNPMQSRRVRLDTMRTVSDSRTTETMLARD